MLTKISLTVYIFGLYKVYVAGRLCVLHQSSGKSRGYFSGKVQLWLRKKTIRPKAQCSKSVDRNCNSLHFCFRACVLLNSLFLASNLGNVNIKGFILLQNCLASSNGFSLIDWYFINN